MPIPSLANAHRSGDSTPAAPSDLPLARHRPPVAGGARAQPLRAPVPWERWEPSATEQVGRAHRQSKLEVAQLQQLLRALADMG